MSDESQQKSVFHDEKTQKMLNEPLSDPTGLSNEDREFMELLINYVKDGKIDLYKPETLINQDVYAGLSPEAQGKVDFDVVNLLASVREIHELYENGFAESFQMQNIVERLKGIKERLEAEGGDLFII